MLDEHIRLRPYSQDEAEIQSKAVGLWWAVRWVVCWWTMWSWSVLVGCMATAWVRE